MHSGSQEPSPNHTEPAFVSRWHGEVFAALLTRDPISQGVRKLRPAFSTEESIPLLPDRVDRRHAPAQGCVQQGRRLPRRRARAAAPSAWTWPRARPSPSAATTSAATASTSASLPNPRMPLVPVVYRTHQNLLKKTNGVLLSIAHSLPDMQARSDQLCPVDHFNHMLQHKERTSLMDISAGECMYV